MLSPDRSRSESRCNYKESSLIYSHYQGVMTPQLREEQLVASAEVQPRASQMTHSPPAFWRPSPSHQEDPTDKYRVNKASPMATTSCYESGRGQLHKQEH